ncbi:MAG: hypothetical protein JW700_00870 [Candidatus Aenigmarchaeota archaeon]|nr:hypothetical protein [Candidatus Aenigmarchaeota archaeon]
MKQGTLLIKPKNPLKKEEKETTYSTNNYTPLEYSANGQSVTLHKFGYILCLNESEKTKAEEILGKLGLQDLISKKIDENNGFGIYSLEKIDSANRYFSKVFAKGQAKRDEDSLEELSKKVENGTLPKECFCDFKDIISRELKVSTRGKSQI